MAFSDDVEHIVVSGTKTAKLLSNSPVLVNVIDGETLKALSQSTVARVLDFIPGVVVERSVKDGYKVQMQGFDSKHVLILVNGQPLISPAESSVDLDQISASDIERVEVVKGAASVLYGSAAMGGVINIITKTNQGQFASVFYEAGSYLNNNVDSGVSNLTNMKAGTQWLGWQHNIKVQIVEDAGFQYDENKVQQDAANLDKTFIQYAANKDVGKFNTRVSYQFFDELKERVTGTIPGQSGYTYYTSDVSQHQLDVNLSPSDNNWKVNARYIRHDETSGRTGSLRDAVIQLGELEGLKVWQHGNLNPKTDNISGSETVMGFSAHFDSLEQTKAGTAEITCDSRNSIESYAQYNYVTRKYQTLAGIRAQKDSDFDFHSAIRLSGMAKLGSANAPITVRIGAGQGYRVPDLKERCYRFDHSNLGYMVLGNENLTPEESDTLTASITYNTSLFSGNADYSVELNSHYSDTNDLIATVTDAEQSADTGLDISVYQNIENAKIHGFDVSNELTFNHWITQLNYSYVDSKDDQDERLKDRPRHQVKLNFGYEFSDWDLESLIYLIYQADEEVPTSYVGVENNEYTIVNFTVNQFITRNLQWNLAFNNIFDVHRSNKALTSGKFDARPASSRELRLGLEYKF